MSLDDETLPENAAARATGVPLKLVHRIIDAGLLGKAAMMRKGERTARRLVPLGLKPTHGTTEILTVEGRQRLASAELQAMESELRRGLTLPEKTLKMIVADQDALGGAPCLKGTRIPACDIAGMVADGESKAACPALTNTRIAVALPHSRACPRGLPRQPRQDAGPATVATAFHV